MGGASLESSRRRRGICGSRLDLQHAGLDPSLGVRLADPVGALLPEPTQDAAEVPREALAGGMAAWALADSPWTNLVDHDRFAQVLDGVRRLQPTRIFSSHLPAASGTSLETFLQVLETVPDAEPLVPPSNDEFAQMLQALFAQAPAA